MTVYDSKTKKFEHPQVTGTLPPPKAGHTATIIKGESMIVFGGYKNNSRRDKVVRSFNLSNYKWGIVPGASYARSGHTACLYNSQILLFGG